MITALEAREIVRDVRELDEIIASNIANKWISINFLDYIVSASRRKEFSTMVSLPDEVAQCFTVRATLIKTMEQNGFKVSWMGSTQYKIEWDE